jgi:hypothetical protein
MKKLYLLFMAVTAFITTTTAQCPNPNGKALPFNYPTECYVYVTMTLPNADINVYNGVTRINTTDGQTDALGAGMVFYNCATPITLILLTRPDGTVCEISGDDIGVPATLPVKLSAFNAQLKSNGSVSIQWASEFEVESEKFVVQRSLDGVNYTNIGEVASAGFSMSTKRYSLDDAQLGERDAYYRLNMVDIDGKSEFSKSIYVNNRKGNAGNASLKVFPNPFRADIQIVGVSASEVNRRNIKVYTVAGKEINYTISGSNAITLDNRAPRGVYILRIHDKTFKLIKE